MSIRHNTTTIQEAIMINTHQSTPRLRSQYPVREELRTTTTQSGGPGDRIRRRRSFAGIPGETVDPTMSTWIANLTIGHEKNEILIIMYDIASLPTTLIWVLLVAKPTAHAHRHCHTVMNRPIGLQIGNLGAQWKTTVRILMGLRGIQMEEGETVRILE